MSLLSLDKRICFIKHVPNRWTSLYDVIVRFIKLAPAINPHFKCLNEDTKLYTHEVQRLTKLADLLKPPTRCVKILSRTDTFLLKGFNVVKMAIRKLRQTSNGGKGLGALMADNLWATLKYRIDISYLSLLIHTDPRKGIWHYHHHGIF